MKSWLLYFLAILIAVITLPLIAKNSIAAQKEPMITVCINGQTSEMSIEEYSLRAMAAVGMHCGENDSLCALAIAARSCGYYFSLYGGKHDSFDVCGSGDCCIALADPTECDGDKLALYIAALEKTYGEILFYENDAVCTLFTLCAGSGTADCESFPYLISVGEDIICDTHVTEKQIDKSAFSEEFPNLTSENTCFVYGDHGSCEFGVVNGKLVDSEKIAEMLSLPCTEFSLTSVENNIVITAQGVGHDHGLSLCGASEKASRGYTYEKILEFYFPLLKLRKLYTS